MAGIYIQVWIREQAETVLKLSLNDPHPRLHWAAFKVIKWFTTKSRIKENVSYLNKFLPRVVAIFKSTSIYPRIQVCVLIYVHKQSQQVELCHLNELTCLCMFELLSIMLLQQFFN